MNASVLSPDLCNTLISEIQSGDEQRMLHVLKEVFDTTGDDHDVRVLSAPQRFLEAIISTKLICELCVQNSNYLYNMKVASPSVRELFAMTVAVCCRVIEDEAHHDIESARELVRTVSSVLDVAIEICRLSVSLSEAIKLFMLDEMCRVLLCEYFVFDELGDPTLAEDLVQFFVPLSESQAARDLAHKVATHVWQLGSSERIFGDNISEAISKQFSSGVPSQMVCTEFESGASTPSQTLVDFVYMTKLTFGTWRWWQYLARDCRLVTWLYDHAVPVDHDDTWLSVAVLRNINWAISNSCQCNDRNHAFCAVRLSLYRRWFYLAYHRHTERPMLDVKISELDWGDIKTSANIQLLSSLIVATESNLRAWQRDKYGMSHERITQWWLAIYAHRAITICMALQGLRLPALLLTMIMEADQFAEAAPFRWQWHVATSVKHWHDRNPASS